MFSLIDSILPLDTDSPHNPSSAPLADVRRAQKLESLAGSRPLSPEQSRLSGASQQSHRDSARLFDGAEINHDGQQHAVALERTEQELLSLVEGLEQEAAQFETADCPTPTAAPIQQTRESASGAASAASAASGAASAASGAASAASGAASAQGRLHPSNWRTGAKQRAASTSGSNSGAQPAFTLHPPSSPQPS